MTDPVETPVPPDPAELKERARLFSELEAALVSNIKEAEFLAGEALATVRLPLVSARWSKPKLESTIRSTRRIQAGEEMSQVTARVTALALMTDQAVAAVLSPALLLWEAETVIGGRKVGRYIDMAAKEWNFLFKEIINNSLSGEYVQHIFAFLKGQYEALIKLAGQKTSSNFLYHLNRSELCDRFFGRFSIRMTLDGRVNKYFSEVWPGPDLSSPSSISKHNRKCIESLIVKPACNNNNLAQTSPTSTSSTTSPPRVDHSNTSGPAIIIKQVFGPSMDDFDSEAEILPLHGFMIGSYSIPLLSKKPVCWIGKKSISLSWAPNHRLFLTAKDLDAVILSPDTSPSPPLFLYLSSPGCLKIMKLSQRVNQIPHASFSSKSPSNQKKIVLNIKDLTPELRETLKNSFEKSMDLRYSEVILTFAKLLSFGIVDYERAFTDPGVKVQAMKVLNKNDEESEHDDYEASPDNSGCDSDDEEYFSRERIDNEMMVSTILNDLLSIVEDNVENRSFDELVSEIDRKPENINLVESIVDNMIDEAIVNSALKKTRLPPAYPPTNTRRHKEASKNKDFDSLKDGEQFEVWIYVNGHDIRIKLYVAKNKGMFLQINERRLMKKHPGLHKIHSKILKNSWKSLKKDPKALSYDLSQMCSELYTYSEEPVAKKPKITVDPISANLNSSSTNNNLNTTKNNLKSPQSSKGIKGEVSGSKSPKEKEDVIDLTKSKSDAGCCDDCRYVTKMHKARMLTGKYKCKCHPCVLRQQALSLGRTDPFKITKITEFKDPRDYWRQPWLQDLYEDILKGYKDLTQEKIFKMTGSHEIMKMSRIYEKK